MEVQLAPDQQVKLSRMAEVQGRTAEVLVQEAVERLLQMAASELPLRDVTKLVSTTTPHKKKRLASTLFAQ